MGPQRLGLVGKLGRATERGRKGKMEKEKSTVYVCENEALYL